MPFASDQQRKFIFAAASRGEEWAKKFIEDVKRENPGEMPMRGFGAQQHFESNPKHINKKD